MFDCQRLFATTDRPQPERELVDNDVAEFNENALSVISASRHSVLSRILALVARASALTTSALACSVALAGQLTVSWNDNSGNEAGFRVERSANGSAFAQIATVGANVIQYLDTAVAASTTYAYRIRAFNTTSLSAYSNTVSVTTTSSGLAPSTSTSTSLTSSTTTLTSTTSTTTTTTTTIPSRLTHLSAKAVAENGYAQSIVVNFTVTGASKSILLRGIGPGLKIFTTATTLPDPRLTVYDGSTVIASNDNWGGTSTLSTTFSRVGAFPLVSSSKDAALVRSFSVKSYSAITNGNYSGLALAEIFDADTSTSPSGRLSKILARASVGTGGEVLVVGFAVKGDTNLRLVIRAIGPSLTGLTGLLLDPKLALYRGTSLLRSNDNWGGTSALSSAFVKAGAYALSASSKDSAMDITLAPGTYTATISGVNSTKGVARFEMYEIR